MTLIGPVTLKLGTAPGTEFGDDVMEIQRTTPKPVTIAAINRDISDLPKRGHGLTVVGVEGDLSAGTLWRYLYDHRGEKDVPVAWATASEGVSWTGVIAVVPDPTQGGKANQHGTFNVPIPLVGEPTLVDAAP